MKYKFIVFNVILIIFTGWIWYSNYVHLTINNNSNDTLNKMYIYYKANQSKIAIGNLNSNSKQYYRVKFPNIDTPIELYYQDKNGHWQKISIDSYTTAYKNHRYDISIQP